MNEYTNKEIEDFIMTYRDVWDKSMREDNRSRFSFYGSKSLSIIEQLQAELGKAKAIIGCPDYNQQGLFAVGQELFKCGQEIKRLKAEIKFLQETYIKDPPHKGGAS